MIATLSENKKGVVLNDLKAKYGMKKDVEYLHHLYSAWDYELGYIQHGRVRLQLEKPRRTETIMESGKDREIEVYDSHRWGEEGIRDRANTKNLYPIEYCTTRAKNTLIIIRQMLKKEYNRSVLLSSFFVDSCKEVHKQTGILMRRKFDLSMQVKKLEYILSNPELSLSLLEEAYLDFSLFVDLLTKVNIESMVVEDPSLIAFFGEKEVVENTKILTLAKEFANVKIASK